ncbi:MAG: hypothetical protein ACRDN8_19490 [Thermoleophilaceae bacterium]
MRVLVRELREPGQLGGGADHAGVVRHPQGPVRARLLPGRLHGLDDDGTDFASMFGQAFVQNDASQYFSRLTP